MRTPQTLSIDKIIAVESILQQIRLLQDFCFDSIIILEEHGNSKTREECFSLEGFEDSGIVSLIAPELVPLRVKVSDILQITQSWKGDNLYQISMNLIQGTITILFQITSGKANIASFI